MFERKNRPGVKARNLPRVLLLCHPDTPNILEVVDELLKIENICVIYNTDITLFNDVSLVLDAAQLALVYVDKTFIEKRDEILLKNIELLKQQKLQVIPIVSSEEFVDEFNEMFGEIQYISYGDKDKFVRKLQGAFEIYLFKEDIAEEIKESFSSFVFVSYRHKDLLDAQKVINAIHNDERNYNVGIWYDDYLTSGEKFGDEIEKEIRSADGFILITTPNLVNEDNYVRRIEYKIAHDENKKIVPIETLDTDKVLLKEQYQDIPDSLKIDNQKEIDEEIYSSFGGKDFNEARQKFYLGVAYLKGIYVEKNFERAIKLLDESSDMGYFPASSQLVAIYENGINTDIDHIKAAFYQRRVVEYLYEHEQDVSVRVRSKRALSVYLYNSFITSNEVEPLLLECIKELREAKSHDYQEIATCFHTLLIYYISRYTNEYANKLNDILAEMIEFVDILVKLNINNLFDEIASLFMDIAVHYYQINELDKTVKYAKLGFEYNQKALEEDFQKYSVFYFTHVIHMCHVLSGFAANIYLPHAEQALKEYEKYKQYNKETERNKLEYIEILSLVGYVKSVMGESPLEIIKQADELLLEVGVPKSFSLRSKRHAILLKIADSYQEFSDDYPMIINRYKSLSEELGNFIEELRSSGRSIPSIHYDYYHCIMMLSNYLTANNPRDEETSRIVLRYLDEIKRVSDEDINIDSYKIGNTFGYFHFYGMYLYHYTNIKDKENANRYFDLLINTKMTDYKTPKLYPRMEISVTGLAFAAVLLDRQRDLEGYVVKIINGHFKGDKAFEYTFFYYLTRPYLDGIFDNWIMNRTNQLLLLTCELIELQDDKNEILRLLIPIRELMDKARELGQMFFIELAKQTSHYVADLVKDEKVLPVSKLAYSYVKHMTYILALTSDESEENRPIFINTAIDLFMIIQEAFKNSDHDKIPLEYGSALIFLGASTSFDDYVKQISPSAYDFYTRLVDENPAYYDCMNMLMELLETDDYASTSESIRGIINMLKKAIKEHELVPINIAYLYLNLGNYLHDKDVKEAAVSAYMDCVDELNEEEETYLPDAAFRMYADSFKAISDILKDLGRLEESKQYYEAYLKAKEQIEDKE